MNSKILHVANLTSNIYRIRIENSVVASHALPGQFVNVRVTRDYIPLWRRPFSIHNVNKNQGWFDILFKVVGKGTALLAQKKAGDEIDYIGPLGNGFNINLPVPQQAIVVAGGIGIAPLLFLCRILRENNIPTYLFWGAGSKIEFCCLDELQQWGVNLFFATEDGSRGFHGLVTDLVQMHLHNSSQIKNVEMFACGPNPMLFTLGNIVEKLALSCQFSLETLMACGIGACLGCGVKLKGEKLAYRYVCQDGPVFNSDEIDLSG